MPRNAPTNEKRCPDCGVVKPTSDFYEGISYDGGFSPYCKACHRDRNNRRWRENPEKMRTAARIAHHKHKDKHSDVAAQRTASYSGKCKNENPARWRAKRFFDANRSDVAADITRDYLEELFRRVTNCQCCGKDLELAYKPRDTRLYRANPAAPSIDRVDNRKGYTRSNIAVICWECNFRKTDLTLDDLVMLQDYIVRCGNV